jgi:hypothetical protein
MIRTNLHFHDRPAVQPDLLRDLEEPAARILWVLLLAGRPLPVGELAFMCGRTRSSVGASLSQLASFGLVFSSGDGAWILAADFRQIVAAIARQNPEPALKNGASPESNGPRLESILSHIGISPPALDQLKKRPDLGADPSPVLAWWWFYLTQEWPTNRAGLVIKRLSENRTPQAGFLTLARVWPVVTAADRAEMEQMVWRAYTAGQMARAFSDLYPSFSEKAFVAFLALYEAAPEELGF